MNSEYAVVADYRLKMEVDRHLTKIENLPDQQVVFLYNRLSRNGFFVREQAIRLLSLHYDFIRRFGKSPLIIEDNTILRLTNQICLLQGQIQYADGTPIECRAH